MSESTKTKAAQIFNQAANYIRNFGWQVKGMGKDRLPRCSMGALASAHKTPKWDKKLAKFMYEQLYEELNGTTLTEFNYKYRNGEKVAQLFEKTATRISKNSAI